MPFEPSNTLFNFNFPHPFLSPFLFKPISVNFSPSLKDTHLISQSHSLFKPLKHLPSFFSSNTHQILNIPISLQSTSCSSIMEHQQQQGHEENNNGGGGNGKSSGFLCRQSSTRWIPTTDQIRILKDLYYNSGLRSPSSDQIQRISARLRQYGKIEGKNVFYWFQNHKARERQKRRLTVDIAAASNNSSSNMSSSSSGISPASPGVYGLGQIGSCSSGGSLLMERTYRGCSLPAGVIGGNIGWMGVETGGTMQQFYYHQQRPAAAAANHCNGGYCYNNNHVQYYHPQPQEEEEDMGRTDGIETLPLFPVHTEEEDEEEEEEEYEEDCQNNGYFQTYFLGHQNGGNDYHHLLHNNMDSSLELKLNSYCSPHGSA